MITPSTERCWLNLVTSLKCNKGAAVLGNSGVGKTETVKEFAKAVGRMPVIFNCGEECSLKFIYSFILGVFEAQA